MKNGITRQIMAGYGDLRKSEKKAADYILDHLEEAAGASIDRLAKAADGTFVRLHTPGGDDPGGDPCSCDRDSVQDAGRDAEKHFCEDIQKGGGCDEDGKESRGDHHCHHEF